MTLKFPPNRQSEHIFKTIILQLLLVPLFALPALAKLPKDVREALKNKYLNKVCMIQALAVPALLPERKRGMISDGSAEPKRQHDERPIPGGSPEIKRIFDRGDRRSPNDVAPKESGQGRGYWVFKSARVEIRNGKLAGKKDKKALSKFSREEVVVVKKIIYGKDHIAIRISDLGHHSPTYRSSNLKFFFKPTFLTTGSFNEIFETIDSWLKPVETGYVDCGFSQKKEISIFLGTTAPTFIVTKVDCGERFTIIGEENSWIKIVTVDNKKGYISSELVSANKPATESQPPAQASEETLPRTVVVPPEEQAAFQEAVNQPGTDQMIALGEKFLQDYPESQLRTFVYSALATAYREKNDYDKVVENGEKSIALDPDNVMSLAIVAYTLPQKLQGSGLEMAQKLSRAERYARHGLERVDLLPQPANVLPEEFEKRKSTFKSMLHSALGFVYLQRGISAKSQEEYKIALSLTSSPDPIDYFRLGEAYRGERKYDEAIKAFEKAAELAPGTVVNQLATEQVQKLKTVRDVMQGTGK